MRGGPTPIRRAVRLALLEARCEARDARWREARRVRAREAWHGHDPNRRAALVEAADLLDASGEPVLADWLLRSRPEHAVEVATGVAVHALRRDEAAAYDALQEGGVVDDDVFCDAFFAVERDFVWGPGRGRLVP